MKLFDNVVDGVGTGRVRRREVERVEGMCVNMCCALSMHEGAKRKYKEGNVGAFAPFVNVKPSDVAVIVDVMGDEEGSLESVEDVTRGCGCRLSVWVDVVLVNLIEEDLCGVGIANALHLFRKESVCP